MDATAINNIVNKCALLKHKYVGSFPADNFPPLVFNNSFIIVNTDSLYKPGQHWILLARKGNRIFFGDSLGNQISDYSLIYKRFMKLHKNWLTETATKNDKTTFKLIAIVDKGIRLQTSNFLCGAFCVYFAHIVFCENLHNRIFSDLDVLTSVRSL